jgi:hypothetical protein
MPSHLILAVILGSTALPAQVSLAAAERAGPVMVDCAGKRRVQTAPPRIKKEAARKPCRVIAPILM